VAVGRLGGQRAACGMRHVGCGDWVTCCRLKERIVPCVRRRKECRVRATDDRAVTVHPRSLTLLDPKPANHNDLKRGPEIFCFRFFCGIYLQQIQREGHNLARAF